MNRPIRFVTILSVFSLFTLSLTSCFSLKAPVCKGLSGFRLDRQPNASMLQFDLELENPNNWGLTLLPSSSQLLVGNHPLGITSLRQKIRIPGKSNLSVPLQLTLNDSALTILLPEGLKMLLGNGAMDAAINGNLKVRKFIFRKKFSFNFSKKINLRITD
ncbi:MAG: LEA type 2 family protein [Bacteroidia bacterium]|nr:LEA type 2 family protein [Bacteroidia bacterium]